MLNFTEIIDLSTNELNPAPKFLRDTLLVSCEVNGTISQFYINDRRTNNKTGKLDILSSLYDLIEWSEPFAPITTQRVRSIGIKNFPGYGSVAFYNLLDEERSGILSPVFIEGRRFTKPKITTLRILNKSMIVSFESPEDIKYDAYRLVMRNGNNVFEYVTYETIDIFTAPYIPGIYECHCVGYKAEGEAVSLNSDTMSVSIDESQASENPALKHDIFVKGISLTPEGYLNLRLSNDAEVRLDVSMATKQDVNEIVADAVYDSWEADY
jgi:hypothetical protein